MFFNVFTFQRVEDSLGLYLTIVVDLPIETLNQVETQLIVI